MGKKKKKGMLTSSPDTDLQLQHGRHRQQQDYQVCEQTKDGDDDVQQQHVNALALNKVGAPRQRDGNAQQERRLVPQTLVVCLF
jgi:hypothetical protein